MVVDHEGRRWWKGNLHTHTTRSDGGASPEKAAALYRQKGYDFLALTDHWVFSESRREEGLLLLSGCEYNVGATAQEGIFHIVGVGMETPPALENRPGLTPQGIIDGIHAAGGLAILAHPAWSLNRVGDVLRLNGLDGTEIYNTVSGTPWNARPYSGAFVDLLAVEGRLLPCVAADDAHFYQGDETRSYILVQADGECTPAAVRQAIRDGRFYATQGPTFSLNRRDGVLEVACSPVREVVFYSDSAYASDRVTRGDGLTSARYALKPSDHFVRVELTDREGNTAWSSPLAV